MDGSGVCDDDCGGDSSGSRLWDCVDISWVPAGRRYQNARSVASGSWLSYVDSSMTIKREADRHFQKKSLVKTSFVMASVKRPGKQTWCILAMVIWWKNVPGPGPCRNFHTRLFRLSSMNYILIQIRASGGNPKLQWFLCNVMSGSRHCTLRGSFKMAPSQSHWCVCRTPTRSEIAPARWRMETQLVYIQSPQIANTSPMSRHHC